MTEIIVTSIIALCMGAMVIFIRLKASNKPVSVKKIILPPFFMSTGLIMFFIPYFRLTMGEVLESIVVGMVFSTLLIKTSRFEVRENDIYLKRSKAFPFILVGLLLIRLIMKIVLSSSIDVGQLSGMFFLLAFSMIVPWRVAMYVQYRKLASDLDESIQTKGI